MYWAWWLKVACNDISGRSIGDYRGNGVGDEDGTQISGLWLLIAVCTTPTLIPHEGERRPALCSWSCITSCSHVACYMRNEDEKIGAIFLDGHQAVRLLPIPSTVACKKVRKDQGSAVSNIKNERGNTPHTKADKPRLARSPQSPTAESYVGALVHLYTHTGRRHLWHSTRCVAIGRVSAWECYSWVVSLTST